MLLYDLLRIHFEDKKVAVIDDVGEVTYSELIKRVDETADRISKVVGLRNNIGIYIDNSIEYLVAYFAISKCGCTIVPIYTQLSVNEVVETINLCQIQLVITTKKMEERFKRVYEEMGEECGVFLLSANAFWGNTFKIGIGQNDEDVSILLPTSGTSASIKRVMLTCRGLINNARGHISSVKMTSNDVTLVVLAACFGYCNVTQLISSIYLGGTIVMCSEVLTAERMGTYIEDYRITNITCIPNMLKTLLLAEKMGKFDLSSLKYICFGGSKTERSILYDVMYEFSNVDFFQTYGQTEAGPRISTKLVELEDIEEDNMGMTIDGVDVKIVNDMDEELANMEIGEICVRSNSIMKGYYNNREQTNRVMAKGYLKTGDLGYLDCNQEIHLLGRIINVVKVFGMNVEIEEVENVLCSHHDIMDACVDVEEHIVFGTILVAKIVLESEYRKDIEENIREYCISRLAKHKIPSKFVFLSEIERTYNGKKIRNGVNGKKNNE